MFGNTFHVNTNCKYIVVVKDFGVFLFLSPLRSICIDTLLSFIENMRKN